MNFAVNDPVTVNPVKSLVNIHHAGYSEARNGAQYKERC